MPRWLNSTSSLKNNLTTFTFAALLFLSLAATRATEFHVAKGGSDANPGTRAAPFRTIQHAADLAQPGDVVTVYQGVYRERITPPRGGASERKRIVYQAAPGEMVEVKGSEVVTNWVQVQENVWQATLPNSFFGSFNPFQNLIHGDWFDDQGRKHSTGAVYLNGDWLMALEHNLSSAGMPSANKTINKSRLIC